MPFALIVPWLAPPATVHVPFVTAVPPEVAVKTAVEPTRTVDDDAVTEITSGTGTEGVMGLLGEIVDPGTPQPVRSPETKKRRKAVRNSSSPLCQSKSLNTRMNINLMRHSSSFFALEVSSD